MVRECLGKVTRNLTELASFVGLSFQWCSFVAVRLPALSLRSPCCSAPRLAVMFRKLHITTRPPVPPPSAPSVKCCPRRCALAGSLDSADSGGGWPLLFRPSPKQTSFAWQGVRIPREILPWVSVVVGLAVVGSVVPMLRRRWGVGGEFFGVSVPRPSPSLGLHGPGLAKGSPGPSAPPTRKDFRSGGLRLL